MCFAKTVSYVNKSKLESNKCCVIQDKLFSNSFLFACFCLFGLKNKFLNCCAVNCGSMVTSIWDKLFLGILVLPFNDV